MKRALRDPEPAKRWLTFLHNHRDAISAMDFFTVPTITFSALYCFFVISHDRRRILHFNVTKHPTSSWIVQQLREAFPFRSAPRFVIFDRDAQPHVWPPLAFQIVSGTWDRRADQQAVSAVLVVLFLPVQSALSSSSLILPSRNLEPRHRPLQP
jgi:hypothetical protein